MQALIKSGSSQYLVVEGQEIVTNKLKTSEKTFTFSEVLLFTDDKLVLVGTPFLQGYSVIAEVMGEEKGEKVRVFKYKAKSRYRKTTGFRANLTRLKIKSINTPNTPAPTEAVKSPVKKVRTKKTKTVETNLDTREKK